MSEATTPLTPFLQWWQRAPLGQKLAAVLCVAICVSAVWAAVAIGARTDYRVLYSGLPEKDLGDIVAKLDEAKIPYRLSAGGSISVPSGRVQQLRLELASAGLPTGGSIGFELFDQNRLGLSEFQEKLNYRRALQGELERTITQLATVERARVHIALPERVLFTTTQEKPTASVTLCLRPGAELQDKDIAAITYLVASSVEGLDRTDVTLIDTEGNLLSSPSLEANSHQAIIGQLKAQTAVEDQIGRHVQTMLDRILGPGRSVVRVSALLDLAQRETQEEMYQPQSGEQGIVEQQKETTESFTGNGRAALRSGSSSSRNSRSGDTYERSENETRYRISRKVQTVTDMPGQVKRLQVAVFVDEKAEVPDLTELQEAVATAAGIDKERGDQVVVQQIAFAPPAKEQPPTIADRLLGWYSGAARSILAVVLLLAFVVLARNLMKSSPVIAPAEQSPFGGAQGQTLSMTSGAPAMPMLGASQPGAPATGLDPDRAAKVVRGWLSEGEEQ